MKRHLPARPIPISGESPAGLLIRAVEKNGYRNLQALLWAYWGIKAGKGWAAASFADPERYGLIADTFGIEDAASLSQAFTRAGPTSESDRVIDGMAVPEKLFREDGRYYCPDCLKEHKFWRKLWTLRPYSVCPTHGKLLVRDCTVCGDKLLSWRGKLVTCGCGADLREAASEPADPAALRWWLDCHNGSGHEPAMVDAALLAMADVDESGDLPSVEYIRLTAARDWFVAGKAPSYLAELVQQRSDSIHPRIQLLPMLRSQFTEIRSMGQALLRCWVPCSPKHQMPNGRGLQAREAGLALGISYCELKKFKRMRLVGQPMRRKAIRGQVCRDSVNRLLFALQAERQDRKNAEPRPLTVSTATMAQNILSGSRQGAGYDIEHGLSTLRTVAEPRDEADKGLGKDWLGVSQIAEALKTYPDAIRFLERKGWLPARHRDLLNRRRLIARRADVEAFDRQYVFAAVLAREMKLNPTNLAEKLMELGAQPVSGPSVDGALLYLFKREDVAKIGKANIRSLKTYKTRTGRPKDSSKLAGSVAAVEGIPVVDAARLLGIGVQQIPALTTQGILAKAASKKRAVYLERNSFDDLVKLLQRKDLIPIEEAAARLNQKPATFERLWVKRKVIKVHELVYWRLVSVSALKKLAKTLEGKVTASEAGRLKSMHRSHFPNLERRGAVKSVMLGGGQKIRLYDSSELDRL